MPKYGDRSDFHWNSILIARDKLYAGEVSSSTDALYSYQITGSRDQNFASSVRLARYMILFKLDTKCLLISYTPVYK